jgi:Putative MetA-pathway of phenol degradation
VPGYRLTLALVLACTLVLLPGPARGQFLQPLPAPTGAQPFLYSEPLGLESLAEGNSEREEEADEIETDRDSFTPATTTAGFRRLIVESAWSFIDNRAVPDTNSLPELVTRYGINDWLELRLGWNWEAGGAANAISSGGSDPEVPTENTIERDSQLFYGFKAALTSQNAWRPQSVVILQAGTPTFGRDTATQLVATYAFGWQLANRWKWDSAMRYSYDSSEGDHFNIWAPSTVLKIPLGERWTTHAEYFGVISQGRARDRTQHYFSPGLHYLVTRDLEVGIRVGWGLNDQAANFFSNIGFGWRY